MDITAIESEDNGEALQHKIADYIHGQFSKIPLGKDKESYLRSCEVFPDVVFETLAMLRRNSVEEHLSLWLLSLLGLVTQTDALTQIHYSLSPQFSFDSQFIDRTNMVKPRVYDVCDCVGHFLKNASLAQVYKKNDAGSFFEKTFLHVLHTTFEILSRCPDLDGGHVLIGIASHWIGRLVESNLNSHNEAQLLARERAFPVLVRFLKAAFFTGYPRAILPLYTNNEGLEPTISELYPCILIEKTLLHYSDLVDFYRYSAYLLTTMAVGEDSESFKSSINFNLAEIADFFYLVLLDLPSMHPFNYRPPNELSGTLDLPEALFLANKSHQHVTHTERDEISFFYVINSLLRLNSIQEIVQPNQKFLQEASHFVNSFGKRIASDLDYLASSNQSYSNSVISMLSLEQRSSAPLAVPTAKLLSSILTEGTYKEKLHLVKFFFNGLTPSAQTLYEPGIVNLARTFNFKGVAAQSSLPMNLKHQELLHLISHIDERTTPGKRLYVTALEKIIRLFHLLTVDHLICGAGLRQTLEDVIRGIFNSTYTFDEIASVRQLLSYGNDGKLQKVNQYFVDEDEDILDQKHLLEITHELDRIIHASN